MRARPFLLALLSLALGAAWSFVGPSSVWADEPPPPPAPRDTVGPVAVDRLTAEELEILRRRFPDWDQRDAAERERIASNVMKLRQLSPDDRRRLLERAKKLEGAGPDAWQKLRGWHEMTHAEREQMRAKRVMYRGMGAQVVGALPPDARQLVTPGALPGSLTFPERLRLEVGIASLLRKRILEAYVSNPPRDVEASVGAPPAQVKRLTAARDALRAKGEAATNEDRRRLAEALLEDRLFGLRRRLQGETLAEGARGARFGAMAKEAFPEAFSSVVDEVARRAAKGRQGLVPLLAEGGDGEGAGSPAQRPLAELVGMLERARPVFAMISPDLAAKAEAFQGELLLALGWKPEAVRLLAEAKTEQDRLLKLAMFKRMFGGGPGAGPWGGGGPRRPGGAGPAVPPGGRRSGAERRDAPPPPAMDGDAPGGTPPPKSDTKPN